MSVVIVKASAVTVYQNRTTTENSLGKVGDINFKQQFQATASSELYTTKPDLQYSALNSLKSPKDNLTITNHIIQTNIVVGEIQEGDKTNEILEKSTAAAENMRAKLQQLLQRENDDDDEQKKQLQEDQLQQQQELQYQQQLQLQPSQHAILSSENAYLLERGGGVGGMHEQPIYGTWNAKARRPPAALLAATSTTAAAVAKQSSFVQPLMGEVNENYYDSHNANHHYERLPRRSSTMTPVRRELHDQIPRPPRLTSRQPSLAVRRQFNDDTKGSQKDESRPKPFHFPFEGPLPEEFKKLQQQQSERGGIRPGGGGIEDVNNIQDILQKLHIGSGGSKMPPPLMMMPTGLHISGSYKNLKSSGLSNFFRGKRNKKQMQLQFPMPMPMQMQMLNSYPQPMMNLMPQHYQQRLAMDQFYPYKPRSPNDVNLLAMQQQQQQQKLQFKQSKGKKQKKKQKDKKNAIASSNLMFQQYPFATAATDLLYPSLYPPFMTVNVTQAPTLAHLAKRVPFNVNLDIFPVMPPTKHHKNSQAHLAMDEARIVSRPPTALRNPFMEYFTTPVLPTASLLNYYNQYNQKQPVYNPIRFPTGAANQQLTSMAQSSNMQLAYPEQLQKYLQQQQQQQNQQQHLYANFLNTQGHQTPFLPIDCDQPLPSAASSIAATNSKGNPIMVHLNVFPKQKPSSPISTNPFYSNTPNIQRTSIQEESESSLSPIEPRHQGRSLNDSSLNKIARSDTFDDIQQQQLQQKRLQQQQQDLVDFDHPIVAVNSDDQDEDDNVEDNLELPQPSALQGSMPNISSESSQSFNYDTRPNATLLHHTLTNNTNYNMNYSSGNLEQMASDAKTASLFRFPVEDLIQFQVHDAM